MKRLKIWWLRCRLNSLIDESAMLDSAMEAAMAEARERREHLLRKQFAIRSELSRLGGV